VFLAAGTCALALPGRVPGGHTPTWRLVSVAGFAAHFSPMLRSGPPPFGKTMAGGETRCSPVLVSPVVSSWTIISCTSKTARHLCGAIFLSILCPQSNCARG